MHNYIEESTLILELDKGKTLLEIPCIHRCIKLSNLYAQINEILYLIQKMHVHSNLGLRSDFPP